MNKFLVLIFFVISFSIQAKDHFKIISINDLEKMQLQTDKTFYLYDANVESTRAHVGIIPGAKLIDSSEKYDLKKELPPELDSTLVFYCANTRCTASHLAANKAYSLGYKNVNVMVEGIYGWKKAGKKIVNVKIEVKKENDLPKAAHEITPKDARTAVLAKKAIIIDVREDEERHDVIEGAQWFPMSKSHNAKEWSKFVSSLPKDKQVIFHCAAGFRSKAMAEKLSHEGHDTLYFKGPDQWHEAGLPLINGPVQ